LSSAAFISIYPSPDGQHAGSTSGYEEHRDPRNQIVCITAWCFGFGVDGGRAEVEARRWLSTSNVDALCSVYLPGFLIRA
jgi:hypothetical protein